MASTSVTGGAGLAAAAAMLLGLGACGGPGNTSAAANSATAMGTSAPAAAPALTAAQSQALVDELPAAYHDADLANGEAKFAACRSCHTTDQGGEDMIGPNLWGIFGRKAGSKPGFSYSDGLKNAGWTWDADRINQWIANPRAVVPDTKMTFVGLPDATDRRDVVAYLKTVTSPPPAASPSSTNDATLPSSTDQAS